MTATPALASRSAAAFESLRRQRRKFGGVADGDAALIVAPLGLPADFVEMPPGRIEIEVEMQVDIDVEFLGEVEQSFDLRIRIGVHIGAAADQIGAVAQRGDQQFLGAGIVGQAFLRKGADREIERPGIIALQRLDRLKAAQADARVDLDMGAHARGAVHDRALDHAGAAGIDVLDGEIALHRGDRADGIADAAMVVAAAAEQAGLVEMDMGVDETRQHQPAVGVDLAASQASFGAIAAILPPEMPISTGVGRSAGSRRCGRSGRRRFRVIGRKT